VKLSEASRNTLKDGDRIAEPRTYRVRAIACARNESNEWSNVRSHFESAVSIVIDAGMLPQAALCQFRYAECLHKKGDLPTALEQLHEAERYSLKCR